MARILIGNIKGPKGDTGPKGATGAIGPVGPQGPLPPLANNFLATVPGVSALDAVAGKTLKDEIDLVNSDLSGYGSFLSTGADLNTLKTGVYFFNGYGTFTGTKPFTDKFGMFLCAKPSEGTRIQAAISDAGELKVRVFENAAWKPWK